MRLFFTPPVGFDAQLYCLMLALYTITLPCFRIALFLATANAAPATSP